MSCFEFHSKKINLKTNKAKSGIMVVFKRKNPKYPTGKLLGIPYIKSYKYLGTHLNYTIRISDHLDEIERKHKFIKRSLMPLLMKRHHRLNMNLFRILVVPSFRMVGGIYSQLTDSDQRKVDTLNRRLFRDFMLWPTSTPNQTVHDIIG